MSNKQLDNYEVCHIIGSGSFGTCYKIKHKEYQKFFVWKAIDYGEMTEEKKKLLVSEVNVMSEFNSKHIVQYHDRIIEPQTTTLYIIMEYCPGGDLATLIKTCQKAELFLDECFIWKVLYQLSIALQVCHTSLKNYHVLHRDIKPANVFLDENQNVKLGDFGLARVLSWEESHSNTLVGTPYYMSPEVILGGRYNLKSDVWALGCLIYELCSFRPPFHGENLIELSKQILDKGFYRIPHHYSEDLHVIILYMLSKDNKIRPTIENLLHHPLVMKCTSDYRDAADFEAKLSDKVDIEFKVKVSSEVVNESKAKECSDVVSVSPVCSEAENEFEFNVKSDVENKQNLLVAEVRNGENNCKAECLKSFESKYQEESKKASKATNEGPSPCGDVFLDTGNHTVREDKFYDEIYGTCIDSQVFPLETSEHRAVTHIEHTVENLPVRHKSTRATCHPVQTEINILYTQKAEKAKETHKGEIKERNELVDSQLGLIRQLLNGKMHMADVMGCYSSEEDIFMNSKSLPRRGSDDNVEILEGDSNIEERRLREGNDPGVMEGKQRKHSYLETAIDDVLDDWNEPIEASHCTSMKNEDIMTRYQYLEDKINKILAVQSKSEMKCIHLCDRDEMKCNHSCDKEEMKFNHLSDKDGMKCNHSYDKSKMKCNHSYDRYEMKCTHSCDKEEMNCNHSSEMKCNHSRDKEEMKYNHLCDKNEMKCNHLCDKNEMKCTHSSELEVLLQEKLDKIRQHAACIRNKEKEFKLLEVSLNRRERNVALQERMAQENLQRAQVYLKQCKDSKRSLALQAPIQLELKSLKENMKLRENFHEPTKDKMTNTNQRKWSKTSLQLRKSGLEMRRPVTVDNDSSFSADPGDTSILPTVSKIDPDKVKPIKHYRHVRFQEEFVELFNDIDEMRGRNKSVPDIQNDKFHEVIEFQTHKIKTVPDEQSDTKPPSIPPRKASVLQHRTLSTNNLRPHKEPQMNVIGPNMNTQLATTNFEHGLNKNQTSFTYRTKLCTGSHKRHSVPDFRSQKTEEDRKHLLKKTERKLLTNIFDKERKLLTNVFETNERKQLAKILGNNDRKLLTNVLETTARKPFTNIFDSKVKSRSSGLLTPGFMTTMKNDIDDPINLAKTKPTGMLSVNSCQPNQHHVQTETRLAGMKQHFVKSKTANCNSNHQCVRKSMRNKENTGRCDKENVGQGRPHKEKPGQGNVRNKENFVQERRKENVGLQEVKENVEGRLEKENVQDRTEGIDLQQLNLNNFHFVRKHLQPLTRQNVQPKINVKDALKTRYADLAFSPLTSEMSGPEQA